MSWLHYHEIAETLADEAQVAAWRGETRKSQELYRQAAQAEAKALEHTGRDKPRTKGITAVSAAALYLKAGEKAAALDLAKQCLATEELAGFARDQLKELQQIIETRTHEPKPQPTKPAEVPKPRLIPPRTSKQTEDDKI